MSTTIFDKRLKIKYDLNDDDFRVWSTLYLQDRYEQDLKAFVGCINICLDIIDALKIRSIADNDSQVKMFNSEVLECIANAEQIHSFNGYILTFKGIEDKEYLAKILTNILVEKTKSLYDEDRRVRVNPELLNHLIDNDKLEDTFYGIARVAYKNDKVCYSLRDIDGNYLFVHSNDLAEKLYLAIAKRHTGKEAIKVC